MLMFTSSRALKRGAAAAFVALAFVANPFVSAAQAMKIQDITTPGGIKAWLVEEHSVPLMALRFSFKGGSAQDPAGKEGVAHFLTGMMDEGAGDLDAQTFQGRMEELAMRMSFEDGKDSLYGSFETLTENRAETQKLLKLVLNKPRFDADAHDRVRNQLLSSLAAAARNPDSVANERWLANAFPGHPYGRPANGTPAALKAIVPADLEAYRKNVFAKDSLRIVIVGDITAAETAAFIDDVFGALTAKGTLTAVAPVVPKPAEKMQIIEMPVPQSVARFGLGAMGRKDKDFMTGFVMNHIIGGGGFSSRLMEEVREKRGLAYSVYSYLQPYDAASLFGGGVATKNEQMAQSLDIIRSELKRMADEGPLEKELDGAKSNLTGSFALRFDTNSKIASQLLYFLAEDLGIDYVDKRNKEVDAVTVADVKRVAKRMLITDDLFVTVVGKPVGLTTK
jgi:zinc protease